MTDRTKLRSLLLLLLLAQPALAKTAKNKSRKSADTASVHRELGLGAGLLILFPPMPTLSAEWRLRRYGAAGIDLGAMSIPVGDFSGSSTFMGVSGRFEIPGTPGIFAGLTAGRRTFRISTVNDLAVNDVVTEVTWTREVSQGVVYPKAGWITVSPAGHGFILAAGLVMPTGSSFSISHDPEEIEGGITDDQLADEERIRARDVKDVTHAKMLSVEFRYNYYIDVVR